MEGATMTSTDNSAATVVRGSARGKPGTAPVRGRAAAEKVQDRECVKVDAPILGTVRLPRPEQLVYYLGVGALAAVELIEWPIAVALAAGHALATQQKNRTVQAFGEALEDA
jgi:hypothetical protein